MHNLPRPLFSASASASVRACSRLARRPLTTSRVLASSAEKEAAQKTTVSANYTRPPAPKTKATGTQLPVAPLIIIFFAGSFSFYQLSKSRDGSGSSHYVLPARDTQETREEWLNKKRA